MRKVMDDPEVKAAIGTLQTKGVTLNQITAVYRHFNANLPAPGTKVKWKATQTIKTVRENRSQLFRVEDGYIQIQNDAGTELFLLPHEYEVLTPDKGGIVNVQS